MATIACDICGGALSMDARGDFALCDSCGMKHTKDRVKQMTQEVTGVVAVSNMAGIESLMKRGWLAIEDSKWGEAIKFFDRVLDINAENASAFIGRLCVDLQISKEDDLIKRPTLTMFPDYQKALRFARGDYLGKIQTYDRFSEDLLKNNKLRLEKMQQKIAKNAKSGLKATLKSDGTVVATGGEIKTIQYKHYEYLKEENEYSYKTSYDGYYAGTSRNQSYGEIDGISTGRGPCDTDDWRDVIAVTVGERHTVGLKKDGKVVAAGLSYPIEFYYDTYRASGPWTYTSHRIRIIGEYIGGTCGTENWHDIVAIAAGSYHTVGLTKLGKVVATGRNEKNQCCTYEWFDIVSIAASDDYTIGLKADGTIVATGNYNSKIKQWKDIATIISSGNNYFGIKSDSSIVVIKEGADVTGSEEQIVSMLEEEEKKRKEQERIDNERREKQEKIDSERRAVQDKKDREERERQEEEQQKQRKIEERERKTKEIGRKNGAITNNV